MRFTSVDNRSRSIWLLAGLGVLLWAAFSVFLSGSSAHADETPGHPTQSQSRSQQHAQPKRAPLAAAAPKPAAVIAPVTAPERITEAAPQRIAEAAPQRIAAVEASVSESTPIVATVSQLPRPVKDAVARTTAKTGADVQGDRREPRARPDHGDRGQKRGQQARAAHADHRPAHAAAPLTHTKHVAHASSATLHAAHASAGASVTIATTSDDTVEYVPFGSDGTSTHHQPAAPPSVASAAAGTSASPGVLPGAAHASDVLGLLLTAAHADDDVLPSGPAGSTDNSPD